MPQVSWDKDRSFYLAKVYDGVENFYIFNVPPTIKLNLKAVLKDGEMIAYKDGKKPFKRMNSLSDGHTQKYVRLDPFVFTGTGSAEELRLLALAKKNAPIPGAETRREAPPKEEPTQKVQAKPVAPLVAKTASPIVVPPTEYFGDRPVLRSAKGTPYIPQTKTCIKCSVAIPGGINVSEVAGKFTRAQMFKPFDKKANKIGMGDWECPECAKGQEAPVVEQREVKPKAHVNPKFYTPPEGATVINGMNALKFEIRDGVYFFQGIEIVKDKHGYALYRESDCGKCGTPIKFRSGVVFHGDKPWNVCGKKPLGQKAVPMEFKSQSWKCECCNTGKAPAVPGIVPTSVLPVSAADPEKVTLSDVVLACSEAGAEVSFQLEPLEDAVDPVAEEQELPPPPQPTPPAYKTHLAKLEVMALDTNIEDKMFRGAAWMLARTLGGGYL